MEQQEKDTTPIYYVIVESMPHKHLYPVWRILKSISCTIDDIHTVWEQEVGPLGNERNIQGMMFQREPANPFKDADVPFVRTGML